MSPSRTLAGAAGAPGIEDKDAEIVALKKTKEDEAKAKKKQKEAEAEAARKDKAYSAVAEAGAYRSASVDMKNGTFTVLRSAPVWGSAFRSGPSTPGGPGVVVTELQVAPAAAVPTPDPTPAPSPPRTATRGV